MVKNVKNVKNAEPRWRGIVLALGSFGLLGLEGCVLPEYQPPQNNETTSVGGASSSSSSGGGQGGATSSSSSTSSGNSGSEDCTNGMDDDGDDAVDCADSDCNAGYECVAPEPVGWIGYMRIHERDTGAPPAACPEGTTEGNVPLYFDPWGAECTACTCTPAGECMLPTVTVHVTDQCPIGGGTVAPANGTLCAPSVPQLPSYVQVMPAALKGEGCNVTAGELVHKERWKKTVDVCKVNSAGGGCANGNVCVPRSNAVYGERICVAADGGSKCPDGFNVAHVYAKNADDTRACQPCTCDETMITCEGGKVSFNSGPQCGGVDVPITAEKCTKVETSAQSLKWTPAQVVVPPNACTQGVGTGQVTGKDLVAICCSG